MKLKSWLTLADKSTDEFAKIIGVSGAAVRRYCSGRMPQRPILLRIREATDGAVTADDFLDEEPERGAVRAA